MALEGIEVTQAGRTQDRRPKGQVGRLAQRIVVIIVRGAVKVVEDLGQRRDAQATREHLVERRQRLAEEDRIMDEALVLADRASSGDLEVEPPGAGRIERGVEPVGGAGRRVPLPGMGDLHRPESSPSAGRARVIGSLARAAGGNDRSAGYSAPPIARQSRAAARLAQSSGIGRPAS